MSSIPYSVRGASRSVDLVNITETNTDDTFYPIFVSSAGLGVTLRADTSSLPFSINPSNGDFNVVDTLKIDQTKLSIGKSAGLTSQGTYSIAVGYLAGLTSQGISSVVIGAEAGETRCGTSSVAIGNVAGNYEQGNYSTAIGNASGKTSQGLKCVAIGMQSGEISQGDSSVAIGNLAGQTSQHANSIVLNASGSALNTDAIDRFFVKPIRGITYSTDVGQLSYNSTSGELTHSTGDSPAFRSNLAPNIVYPIGWNDIIYAISVTQRGTPYDSTTGLFTAPVAGWYQFNAQASFVNASDTDGTIVLSVNNSTTDLIASVTQSNYNASSQGEGRSLSGCGYLALNDTVGVKCYFSIAGITSRSAGFYAGWFSGFLIS